MARALADILTELNSVYQPQKDLYNQQITNLDPQMEAENKGLEAQKTDSFSQITSGANRRGLLFSGIPLQEQASYLGQSFLPAVANLKAKYAQQRFNLQDAIAKITQDQYSKAYGLQQQEIANETAAEAARRAGSGGGSGGGSAVPSFGFSSVGSAPTNVVPQSVAAPAGPAPGRSQQDAYNAIQSLLRTGNSGVIKNTIKAIQASAARGNQYDKWKLEILASVPSSNPAIRAALGQRSQGGGGGAF